MTPLASLLFRLYAIKRSCSRQFIRNLATRIEGGQFQSLTLRRIFREYHGVDIGLYSHGGCFDPWAIQERTTIGRYCSFAHGIRVMTRNHPMERRSTHAFFFNPEFGYVAGESVEYVPLEIGHDVWMGACALVHPHVRTIGTGAVIGAGAVVTRNVPPYAVVVGNPARVVRYRFPQELIDRLLSSRWWEKAVEELELQDFAHPLVPAGLLEIDPAFNSQDEPQNPAWLGGKLADSV